MGGTVLCFGEALWDVTPAGRLAGGAPLNVALRLASLGHDTTLLTRVGDDEAGRELIDYMSAHGLSTAAVQVDVQAPTGVVYVDTSDPLAVCYDIVSPTAWDHIDFGPYANSTDRPAGTIVFGSLGARHEDSRSTLYRLLDETRLRVFDVNLRPPFDTREIIETLLEQSDWVKLNETELSIIGRWLGQDPDPDAMLFALVDRYDIEVLCVTCGADGALVYHDGQVTRERSFHVDVVDTIGCGDAFLGTWLSAMLDGQEPGDALRRASAVGALVASMPGANPPITDEMIEELVASR